MNVPMLTRDSVVNGKVSNAYSDVLIAPDITTASLLHKARVPDMARALLLGVTQTWEAAAARSCTGPRANLSDHSDGSDAEKGEVSWPRNLLAR